MFDVIAYSLSRQTRQMSESFPVGVELEFRNKLNRN